MKGAIIVVLAGLSVMNGRLAALDPAASSDLRGDPAAVGGSRAGEGFGASPDTAGLETNGQAGTSAEAPAMERSPLFSMLRSAVLPGWGQFYTGHPYRGGLFFSLEGFLFTYSWAENHRANRDWDAYRTTGDSRFLDAYDSHFKRGRDLVGYALAVFLVNIADAYVSAQLFDFEGQISFGEENALILSADWSFR